MRTKNVWAVCHDSTNHVRSLHYTREEACIQCVDLLTVELTYGKSDLTVKPAIGNVTLQRAKVVGRHEGDKPTSTFDGRPFSNIEADEISDEDLEAAGEVFDALQLKGQTK